MLWQEFDRHVPFENGVECTIHHTHAAFANLLFDFVVGNGLATKARPYRACAALGHKSFLPLRYGQFTILQYAAQWNGPLIPLIETQLGLRNETF
jgi:hypothetical protein